MEEGGDGKARGSVLQVRPESHRNQCGCWWAVTHPPPHPVTQTTSVTLHGHTPDPPTMGDIGTCPCSIGASQRLKKIGIYGNNKLWYSQHKGMASSDNTTLSLARSLALGACRICFAFPRRQSSLMHCWNSFENIQWHRHTHPPTPTHFCLWLSSFHTHRHTLTLSRALMLTCSETVFLRSLPGLHYLELLMQWAMWTWNWKQMLNSVAKSLWLPEAI